MFKQIDVTTVPRSRRVVCKFPSRKLNRIVCAVSFLARDYILLLEYDHDIAFYQEQPCKIHFQHNGKVRVCAPDFLVVNRAGDRCFIRIKPVIRVIAEEDHAFFKTVSNICRERGFDFIIALENDIRQQPRLSNIGLLRRYSLTELGIRHRILCREFFSVSPVHPLGALISFFSDNGIIEPEAVAYALIWHGVISTDLNRPLDAQSLLQPACFTTSVFLGSEVNQC